MGEKQSKNTTEETVSATDKIRLAMVKIDSIESITFQPKKIRDIVGSDIIFGFGEVIDEWNFTSNKIDQLVIEKGETYEQNVHELIPAAVAFLRLVTKITDRMVLIQKAKLNLGDVGIEIDYKK